MSPFAFVCLLLGFTAVAQAYVSSSPSDQNVYKQYMLKYNRMPNDEELAAFRATLINNPGWASCTGCKILVGELKKFITDPSDVEYIKEELKKVCEWSVFAKVKPECLNMADSIVALLHQIQPLLDNPEMVCRELNYCPEQGNQLHLSKRLTLLAGYRLMSNLSDSPFSDLVCDECKFAVTELKDMIENPGIQDSLKGMLKKVCKIVGQYSTECEGLVDQYFVLIVDELLQLLNNPVEVCTYTGMCKESKAALVARMVSLKLRALRLSPVNTYNPRAQQLLSVLGLVQTQQGFNAGCLVCEGSVKMVVDFLSREKMLDTLAIDISKVCTVLPTNLKTNCLDFMNIYTKALLKMLLQEWSPSEICIALHACTDAQARSLVALSTDVKSEFVCESCTALSQLMAYECQDSSFQQMIIQTVERVCAVLPSSFANQCDTMVVEYIPQGLALLSDYLNSDALCSTIHMCPSATTA